jgi:hypothetical protein
MLLLLYRASLSPTIHGFTDDLKNAGNLGGRGAAILNALQQFLCSIRPYNHPYFNIFYKIILNRNELNIYNLNNIIQNSRFTEPEYNPKRLMERTPKEARRIGHSKLLWKTQPTK